MTLKWGVLGAGSVAQRRAMPAIHKATGAELHALFSRDATRAKQLATEHNVTTAYSNIDALLSDSALDAIYVSTPVNLHCEQVIAAAERGLHVLCDKPMALTPEECKQMIAACNANDVHLQVCFLFRFHSCFQQIKTWVNTGRFGKIVHGRMPFLKKYLLDADEWRADPEKGGGGCLMDLGAHSVDLLRYLIGEVKEVSAFCDSPIHKYRVEETGGILMRFENGAQAFTDLSFSVAQCDIVLELYGTEGTVWVYNDNGWQIQTHFDGEKQIIPSQYEDLYQHQFEHFAECVETGEAPLASGTEWLKDKCDFSRSVPVCPDETGCPVCIIGGNPRSSYAVSKCHDYGDYFEIRVKMSLFSWGRNSPICVCIGISVIGTYLAIGYSVIYSFRFRDAAKPVIS